MKYCIFLFSKLKHEGSTEMQQFFLSKEKHGGSTEIEQKIFYKNYTQKPNQNLLDYRQKLRGEKPAV